MNRRYMILLLAVLFLCSIGGSVFGQEITEEQSIAVNAVIQDDDGQALPEVKISGKEGAIIVWSDVDGKFTITVAPGSELLLEKKGYFGKLIAASGVPEIVVLEKAPFLMGDDNTVNIAFGKLKKKESSGIMDVANPGEMIRINDVHTLNDVLAGRYFDRMSGKNPLLVVDGLPRITTGLTAEEIEQVTVLKDVNSSVLFGAQARNGVIMISTKRGEAHKRRINVGLERGLDQPVIMPKYLGSAQYMELYNEALSNDGLPALYSEETIENHRTGNPFRYPDVDYYSDEYLREFRPTNRLNAEFSGGNQGTQYYTNIGLVNSGSLYKLGKGKDANANLINIRANANVRINEFIKSHLDATATFAFDKGPNGSFWNAAATYHPNYYSPLIPVPMLSETVKANLSEGTKYIDGQYLLGGTTQYKDNVYGNMYMSGYNQNIQRLITVTNGFDVDLKGITEGLTLKTLIGIDMYNSFSQTVTNTYAVYQPSWTTVDGNDMITGLTMIGKDEAPGEQDVGNAYFYRQLTAHILLDYDRTFNKIHSVNATALGYYTKLRRDFFVIDDKASHLGLRLAYDYAKKYFVDFSSAYVHSIRLAKDNRDSFSPTVGLSWVVSEEDFLSGSKPVDYLKLKVSAGILNTDITEDIGERFTGLSESDFDRNYLLYRSNLQTSTSYGWNESWSNSTVIIRGYDNQGLTFEKVKNFNVGMEGHFFNEALALDANFFYVNNSGIVVQRTARYSDILSDYIPYENYNANSYKGAELGVNWSKEIGDFSVNLGGNLIYRTSNVDKRDEIYQNDFQYRKGHPVSAVFGLVSDGFFRDPADITSSPDQIAYGVSVPGDIKYKDQDDDGYITDNDQVYLGNYFPPYAYGINMTMKYRGFSLYALCDGQNGGKSTISNNYYWVDGDDKYSEEVLSRWTETTAATATYPRLTTKSSNNNYRTSDFWMYDNSFFRINRVQLTYEFPKSFLSGWGVRTLSFYLRGSNLLMVGKNADRMQLRIGSQPSYRNYAAGLRVSF